MFLISSGLFSLVPRVSKIKHTEHATCIGVVRVFLPVVSLYAFSHPDTCVWKRPSNVDTFHHPLHQTECLCSRRTARLLGCVSNLDHTTSMSILSSSSPQKHLFVRRRSCRTPAQMCLPPTNSHYGCCCYKHTAMNQRWWRHEVCD